MFLTSRYSVKHSKHVLRRLYYDYFFHRQEELWRENALKTLPVLLNSSEMLACGEDLGLVPACVQPVRSHMAYYCLPFFILSLSSLIFGLKFKLRNT